MANTKKLAKLTITEAGLDFTLHIEDEAGQMLELSVTCDRLEEQGVDGDEVKR